MPAANLSSSVASRRLSGASGFSNFDLACVDFDLAVAALEGAALVGAGLVGAGLMGAGLVGAGFRDQVRVGFDWDERRARDSLGGDSDGSAGRDGLAGVFGSDGRRARDALGGGESESESSTTRGVAPWACDSD